ncbi:MAG: EamA family transporter [Candidatus Paceibacterota bacterium]|jgi:transporter family protein
MWLLYAFLASVFAALVAVLGKLGLKNIDPILATTVRGIIMAIFLFVVTLGLNKINLTNIKSISTKDWGFIAASGIAGALSWLFYFVALKNGSASKVSAIDRTSIIFVIFLSALFLGESFGWKSAFGALFIALGAILITLR